MLALDEETVASKAPQATLPCRAGVRCQRESSKRSASRSSHSDLAAEGPVVRAISFMTGTNGPELEASGCDRIPIGQRVVQYSYS